MAEKKEQAPAAHKVAKRFRHVVNGPWFDEGRIVETGIDLSQGEIDILASAGYLKEAKPAEIKAHQQERAKREAAAAEAAEEAAAEGDEGDEADAPPAA